MPVFLIKSEVETDGSLLALGSSRNAARSDSTRHILNHIEVVLNFFDEQIYVQTGNARLLSSVFAAANMSATSSSA